MSSPAETPVRRGARALRTLVAWFDAWAAPRVPDDLRQIDWLRVVPFLALHAACFAVVWVGVSPFAVAVAVGLYLARMFAITAFYHRYFSHRSFRTSRGLQFAFACLAASAVQRGPLWWAAHHRLHHRHSDADGDSHSPQLSGFWWSHVGWVLSRGSFRTRTEVVRDFMKFPELRFLDRFDVVVPALLGLGLYGLGEALAAWAPGLGTNGWQLFVWGFCVSTVALYHGTFSINSLAHKVGSRRYATKDSSRNNLWLSLITLGEGWHNNHHHYPASTRQGFYWWEVDVSWYVLALFRRLGLIWDVRSVPAHVRERGRER